MRSHSSIQDVGIVVPACDEGDRLPECLAAIEVARRTAHRRWSGLRSRVVVVLDRCGGERQAVPWRTRGVEVLVVHHRSAGASRADGVERVRDLTRAPSSQIWIANTDADTHVPPGWLDRQLGFAAEGYQLVVGSVEPDPQELDSAVLSAWRERHHPGEDHPHIHGANLGLTLAAYDLVGGFAPVETGEDVELVEALQTAGVPWLSTATTRVRTSGRQVGRAPHGFSAYLQDIAGTVAADGR